MITEHTHSEHNDGQTPDGEQLSASESSKQPTTMDAPLAEEQTTALEGQSGTTSAEAHTNDAPSTSDAEQPTHSEEPHPVQASDEQQAQPEPEYSQAAAHVPLDAFITAVDDVFSGVSALFVAEPPTPLENEIFPFFSRRKAQAPTSQTETVRPFTDFIEEFRQTEVRLNALLQNQEPDFATLAVENTEIRTTSEQVQSGDAAHTEEAGSQMEEAQTSLTQPTLSMERPVSPLLRPATRLRLPRHGRHRAEEHVKPVELAKPEVEAKEESAPAVEAPQSEEPETRPARRYRFDRPAATASISPSVAKAAPTPASARSIEAKEKRATLAEQKPSTAKTHVAAAPETPTQKASVPEIEPASPEVSAPVTPAPTSERRKRGNHERQREKEQAAPVLPVVEVAVPEKESEPVLEVAIEDLPPLEYAELQAANSRRRRRRRMGTVGPVTASNGLIAPKAVQQPEPVAAAPVVPTPAAPMPMPAPFAAVAMPKSMPAAPVTPPAAQNYNITSGFTVNQMNQGNDSAGPFMGPEPSPARGSVFPTTPQVRHTRNEVLRSATTTPHTVKHAESPLISASSVNHLGNMVAQAIQVQTDRMVSELRRANQTPTNITVSLPAFPSNERVGVFVDVANLLYSARTLRMTVDFGKLLDFLRGNRRLVRAQAYCPTSPQPGDDQMFLQAVKGLGYRITTKNYKTFSSGAKKADLDLDLCMDVVRLVDGKAVDCVVLVSGDSDFMPMLDYCSDHGVRVEVAAFDESMSATLRQACDLFVNLSMLEEIRA
ncbi:MAG: NYN domain-containing protein [Ktedonobacteraceae bacterium]